MRQQEYPATLKEAEVVVSGCGRKPLGGTLDEVEQKATEECERFAREQGWESEEWSPVEADCEYIQAQVMLAEARLGLRTE